MTGEVDLSRIQDLFLKENYLVGLGFQDGFIFFRVKRREFTIYIYDELSSLTADQYSSEAMYGIAARNVENAFRIDTYKTHIYQIFRGICPSALKTYLGVPFATPQHHLDAAARLPKSDWGYISGFESPLNYPSPETEVWVPYRVDIGFAEHNPLNDTIEPLIKFFSLRYEVAMITDPDLILKILERRIECRLATVGGLSDFAYPYVDNYKVQPITLDDDRAAIARKLAPGG